MIQSVQFHKSSFLGTLEWLTIPWEESPKCIYQQLYDKGFVLAATLEDMHRAGLTTSMPDTSQLRQLLQRFSNLNNEMDLWYQDLVNLTPSPMFWLSQAPQASFRLDNDDSETPALPVPFPALEYQSLNLAFIIITFWALKTVVSNAIACISGSILSSHVSHDLRGAATHLLTKHGTNARLGYAITIMRSLPYCLNESMGFLGAQKSLFGFRVALFTLRRHPGEELRWSYSMYQRLNTKRGLRHASVLSNFDSQYSAMGRGPPDIALSGNAPTNSGGPAEKGNVAQRQGSP